MDTILEYDDALSEALAFLEKAIDLHKAEGWSHPELWEDGWAGNVPIPACELVIQAMSAITKARGLWAGDVLEAELQHTDADD